MYTLSKTKIGILLHAIVIQIYIAHVNNKTPSMVPVVISTRTSDLAPLLQKWAKKNPGVPWSKLLDRGLKHGLSHLAGKRYAHLVN